MGDGVGVGWWGWLRFWGSGFGVDVLRLVEVLGLVDVLGLVEVLGFRFWG